MPPVFFKEIMNFFIFIFIFIVTSTTILSETECKNFFFTFKLPTTTIYSSQDIKSFDTDLSRKNMQFVYTFGKNYNIIINASYDQYESNENNGKENLDIYKFAFDTYPQAEYNIIYGNNDWAYVKITDNGTGYKFSDDGKIRTTRSYFLTSNGPDSVCVIYTANAYEFNYYEKSIIEMVKSINFTGKRKLRNYGQTNEVPPKNPNNNTGNDNTQPNPKHEDPKTPVSPPISWTEKKFIDELKGEFADISAFSYLKANKISIFVNPDKDQEIFDFIIYNNKKSYRIISALSDNDSDNVGELSWLINNEKLNNTDLILLMRGNRKLENSWVIPVALYKKYSVPATDNNSLLSFRNRDDIKTLFIEYQNIKKCFEPLEVEEKPAQPTANLPVTTPATKVDKK